MSTNVDIRPATDADLPALVAALGATDVSAGRPARPRDGDGILLVAWRAGAPVGDVVVHWPADPHPPVHERMPGVPLIEHLAVSPPARRQGIGTALLRAAEAAARERGHGMVLLLAGVGDPGVREFLDRRGYVDWEEGSVGDATGRRDVLLKSIIEGVPGLDAWRHAWQPQEAAVRLAGAGVAWHVAGGWALDLWHGRPTREHSDLEIAVPRPHFPRLRARLDGFDLFSPSRDEFHLLAPDEEPSDDRHQVWVCEPAVPAWRMDIFVEPGDTDTWICRRDPSIRAPRARMVRATAAGVPYLAPEAVLLFKARHRRPKDERDFAGALPRLDAAARDWLAGALGRMHPGHPWLEKLAAAG